MLVQAVAETMDESDCANVQGGRAHRGRTRAVGLQTLHDDPQKDAQHHIERHSVMVQDAAQPLWKRQYPLVHRRRKA